MNYAQHFWYTEGSTTVIGLYWLKQRLAIYGGVMFDNRSYSGRVNIFK